MKAETEKYPGRPGEIYKNDYVDALVGSKVRVAHIAASPVHFKAPVYRMLHEDPRIDFTAIFLSSGGARPIDGGYGQPIMFDGSAARGYRAVFLKRAATNPTENDEPRFFTYRDWDVVPAILRGRYDLVWLWGYNYVTHQLAAAAARVVRVPILFGDDQTLLHGRVWWKAFVKRAALPVVFGGFYGHYVGTRNRAFLERYGIPQDRLFFTPYAVDNSRLRNEALHLKPRQRELRSAFGINEDSGPVILYTGRLVPKKQPLFLLDAFERVRATMKCTLLIVGAGSLEQAMRSLVRYRRIPDVQFAGFMDQTNLPRAYAAADIFVLPSKLNETWGVVVNEAMNFSLPIVVSDKVGSAIDLVKADQNGYIVSSSEVEDLANRLRFLVSNQSARESFGRQSLNIIGNWTYDAFREGLVTAMAAALPPEKRRLLLAS